MLPIFKLQTQLKKVEFLQRAHTRICTDIHKYVTGGTIWRIVNVPLPGQIGLSILKMLLCSQLCQNQCRLHQNVQVALHSLSTELLVTVEASLLIRLWMDNREESVRVNF